MNSIFLWIQEAFWRIPDTLDREQLETIADGLELNENGEAVHVDKIPNLKSVHTDKRKKKTRKEGQEKKDIVAKKNAGRFEALQAMAKKKTDQKASGQKTGRKRYGSNLMLFNEGVNFKI